MGVQNGQELTWKCNVCNEMEMTSIFGEEWDDIGFFKNLSKGKSMKWRINNIEIYESVINLNFSIWVWNNRKDWGVKDSDSQITFFSNPNDYSEMINFSEYSSLVPFWFPIPVGEYIGRLNLTDWYEVDNRVLPTINVNIVENAISPEVPSKDIKIIAIYNDQGVLNSYKLYIGHFYVILDFNLDSLPVYVIPTLIGLVSVFLLGLTIFIIMKKKRNLSEVKKLDKD
ncbi:MAG: hypothetical protein ACFE9Y_12300 [Promethearchaeota archaeon]